MLSIKNLIVLLTVSVSLEQNGYLPTSLEKYSRMEEALEAVCPKVDICNTNTSDSTLQPNELVGEIYQLISCCTGCSCHRSCQDNLNCCFPDDAPPTIGENITMECLPVNIGHVEETEASLIPAYRIVSYTPRDGCKDSLITGQTDGNRRKDASCGQEAVAPWGNLYPVYSAKQDKIYKNELCARCHGVDDAIRWQAYLICDAVENDRTIPLSEHLDSLTKGLENSKCSVEFYYPDMSALKDKRCYKETISTCGFQSEKKTVALYNPSNLTTADVLHACESGLNSPVVFLKNVYRNIFCAMCNQVLDIPLLCQFQTGGGSRALSPGITLLLSSNLLHAINDEIELSSTDSRACLQNDLVQMAEQCRNILCPSGQTRSPDGNCFFPIVRWYQRSFLLILKLVYSGSSSILKMFEDKVIDGSTLAERLANFQPLPAHWRISMLYHSYDADVEIDHQMSVMMTTNTNDPRILYRDIDASLAASWTVILNGSTFEFQQSFLEFTNFVSSSSKQMIVIPAWKSAATSLGLQTDFTNTTVIGWIKMYTEYTHTMRLQLLTKTFHCRQISLSDDEYTLLAENQILISNMTKRALFEAEFDLVEDGYGTQTARVCLSDALFQVRKRENGSASRGHRLYVFPYWAFIAAWWFIIGNL